LLLVFLIGIIAYVAGYLIPEMENVIIDIIIRSMACGGIYIILILIFKVSDDINALYERGKNILRKVH
jgi:hypothetical protein